MYLLGMLRIMSVVRAPGLRPSTGSKAYCESNADAELKGDALTPAEGTSTARCSYGRVAACPVTASPSLWQLHHSTEGPAAPCSNALRRSLLC